MPKGARGLVHSLPGLGTYRRWGIAPRPENFAANGSARQYRKESGVIKVRVAMAPAKNMDLSK
jgi:hypothetical protein